jgi:hypothetical protein
MSSAQSNPSVTVTPLAADPTAPNSFARLYALNVNDHVEKKGGFSYLSWPYAVAQLRLADPNATWEVRRFDGLPYLATEAGVFVEVAVTYAGVTLSQIHPVLDSRNRPLMAPNSFEINTSIQRCLVKAIALHGLGLYIYAGEDLPQPLPEAANEAQGPAGGIRATIGPANEPAFPPMDEEPTGRPSLNSDRKPVVRPDRRECISRSQQAHIQKLAIEVGISLDRVLTYFGVHRLDEIAATDFIRVVRSLEKRRQVA